MQYLSFSAVAVVVFVVACFPLLVVAGYARYLHQRERALRETLAWYADEANWRRVTKAAKFVPPDPFEKPNKRSWSCSAVALDRGAKARASMQT